MRYFLLFMLAFILVCCSGERDDPGTVDRDQILLSEAWQQVAPLFADGDTQFAVTSNLTLPTNLSGGVLVSWSVSGNNWVQADGSVTPPALGQTNGQCLLTAHLLLNGFSTNRSFQLTVIADGNRKDGDPDPYDGSLILIKSATQGYWMGYGTSGASAPTNYVHFTYDFYIAKYKITWQEYLQYKADNPQNPDARDSIPSGESWVTNSTQHPVLYVSWFDALRFCNWKSRQAGLPVAYRIQGLNQLVTNVQLLDISGQPTTNIVEVYGYRLPTEAEWEYSARAKGTTAADQLSGASTANTTYVSSGNTTAAVGSYLPNALGLYDMSGNGGEWCQDIYENYQTGFHTNRCIISDTFNFVNDRVMRNYLSGSSSSLLTGRRARAFPASVNDFTYHSFRIARRWTP